MCLQINEPSHSIADWTSAAFPSRIKKSLFCGFQQAAELASLKKICKFANAFFKTAVSVLLYWVNPSLFAISFLAGIIFDDQATLAINKINRVWKSQIMFMSLITAYTSFIYLPVTLAVGSMLWAANQGAIMSHQVGQL